MAPFRLQETRVLLAMVRNIHATPLSAFRAPSGASARNIYPACTGKSFRLRASTFGAARR